MTLVLGDYMKVTIKLLGEILFPSIGFPQNLNSPYTVGTTSKMKVYGTFLLRWGNTGVIIQGDNSAGHCFVLSD